MKNPPLVSVLMPVYNGEAYLRETMDSIVSQSFRDLEFIIVNDGSTDRTEQIIHAYADDRIRYVRNSANKGLIASLNMGLQLARGEYVARIDADDLADRDRIRMQLDFLLRHPDHGLCGTYYKVIDEAGRVVEEVKLPSTPEEAGTFLAFGNCFCHSSIMIRASLLRELRYRDAYEVCEDYDLWYRAAQRSKVSNLPVFATMYRIHGRNVSLVKKNMQDMQVALISRNWLDDHGIKYSAEQLALHTNFLRFNHGYFSSGEKLQALEAWLMELGDALKADPGVHQQLAHKVIIRRWVTICVGLKNISKLFGSRLIKRYRFFYLKCLVEKIADKLGRRNPGYDL